MVVLTPTCSEDACPGYVMKEVEARGLICLTIFSVLCT